MIKLIDYRDIVGDKVITGIFQQARALYGKRIVHLNSTYMGGGVAEILNSLVPLMNDVGLNTGWRIIRGNPDLFSITKKFHNALQGDSIRLTDMKKEIYIRASEEFSIYTHLNHDCVIIHDPQPLPMIRYYIKQQPWIWRCHIDISHPDPELWDFLKKFILKYDLAIVSHENYKKDDIYIEQRIIPPVIDPLSPKNKELSDNDIQRFLKKFGIPKDKPIITQISRFDKWKDPEGVIRIFKKVKKQIDCRLVLCGSMATDDPEGMKIYQKVAQSANNLIESGDVILITSENNILVNSLQRFSDVIIQKSIREGFGLVVAEALWKQAAVVASNVGGIPLQVIDGETGFLCEPCDENAFAERIVQLMKDKKLAERLGRNAKEHIRAKFLITRLLSNYLDLIQSVLL
jgi:trehalose synthase